MYKFVLLLLYLFSLNGYANEVSIPIQAPDSDTATDMDVQIRIVRIYDVHPVDQTYKIDAYIALEWKDERAMQYIPKGRKTLILEDDQVVQWEEYIWNPALEIINDIGHKEVSNRRLIVTTDNTIVYNERFKATLTTNMDFRRFPFDSHVLKIDIEPFSYDIKNIAFSKNSGVHVVKEAKWELAQWKINNDRCYLSVEDYDYLSGSTLEEQFHRFSVELDIERVPGYFIWQIFLPLLIIMMTSWSIFFIKCFTTQLSLVSTLMLTVYAFNFFISGLIPQLPYNTFLEIFIIISFLSIFVQLVTIIVTHKIFGEPSTEISSMSCLIFVVIFIITTAVNSYNKLHHDITVHSPKRAQYVACASTTS